MSYIINNAILLNKGAVKNLQKVGVNNIIHKFLYNQQEFWIH
jgi:hypothetical protein